jgi:hypothetical protein
MWYCPEKYEREVPDINKELSSLKGELNDKEAKISLARFLRANLGLTTELISGIKLAPYQEITLKAFFNRNFSMCVWGRGCGKTFIAAVYCFLQCVFEPRTKILIAGPTFRTARFIFNHLEQIAESKGAELLAQAFGAKAKRNDQFEWQINGGTITAIPLNGEKIRGFRANVLVLDEYLLIPEDIISNVLMPFLVAPQNMKERIEVREIEDKLIEDGHMKEEDRMVFTNDSKMIALSSASYTFENLYRQYKEWINRIYDKDDTKEAKYFISQMGYESLPEHMIDQTIVQEAQDGGASYSSFLREYCAVFTDGSDSYFSAKKMHECTVPDGEEPTTQIVGKKESKYVLAIDPSFSNSPSSDFFAMSILELDDKTEQGTLVHSYAVAGGNLKDHINYLFHIVNNFSLEMVIIDNAGYQFIDSANASKLFKEGGVKIEFFDFDSNKEDKDYSKELIRAKRLYNRTSRNICFKQVFTSDYIRRANEHLQACIDHKKIWFASSTAANASSFNESVTAKINTEHIGEPSILDFIEVQDALIHQTKKQCALIEVKSTAKGTQTFDLPQHLKRSTSTQRARKDNYTTLMLANWAIRCYYDILRVQKGNFDDTFTPFVIK